MFAPESVEDRLSTYAQEAEQRSNAPPKSVHYTATRFAVTNAQSDGLLIPQSPSMSAVDAAIAGRPLPTDSEDGYTGAETPRVGGYAFVDAEPTPSELGLPVTDEEADAAEREAAMALLPQPEEGGPNPFTIHARSERENVLHRLVEKADAGRRKGGRMGQLRSLGITPGGRTPTPRFTSAPGRKRRAESMTPAARLLAASIGRTPREDGAKRSGAAEKAGGWTPTLRTPRPA